MRAEHPAECVGGVTNVDLDTFKPALQEAAKRVSTDERCRSSAAPSLGQLEFRQLELHQLFCRRATTL